METTSDAMVITIPIYVSITDLDHRGREQRVTYTFNRREFLSLSAAEAYAAERRTWAAERRIALLTPRVTRHQRYPRDW